MEFTEYGIALAEQEGTDYPDFGEGASAHMAACNHDTGLTLRLCGLDVHGHRFAFEAQSVLGAFMKMKAASGVNNAWHVREDGTRKLVIRR